jgi:hypothetical protein
MATLTDKGLTRIKASVEHFERQALFHSTPQRGQANGNGCIIRQAIVTTTIPAATAGTPNIPASGVCDLYWFDPSVPTYNLLASGVTVWNDAAGTGMSFAVGSQIMVLTKDGEWFVF